MRICYFVYELVDPVTNHPFYVGKGCNSRHLAHAIAVKRGYKMINLSKCQHIKRIHDQGLEILYRFPFIELSEPEAFAYECKLIKEYGRIKDGGILTNMSRGGSGGIGHPLSVTCYDVSGVQLDTFESLTEAAVHCGIHKSTLCAALTNRTKTAGGYYWCYVADLPNIQANNNLSPVSQYTIDGDFICNYSSVKEAAANVQVTFTSIVDCCARRHVTAGGFRWTYVDVQLPSIVNANRYKNKKYMATNPDNGFTETYLSIKDACRATGANPTGIIDCCAGRKKKSGGVFWSYVYD